MNSLVLRWYTMMKNKTLIQITSTLGLLALVGCSSVKTVSEPTIGQEADLTITDVLVERALSQVAKSGAELAKFLSEAKVGGKAVATEAEALSTLNKTLARLRKSGVNLGINSQVKTMAEVETNFSEAEAERLINEVGVENAAYATFAKTEAGKAIRQEASSKSSQSTVEGLSAETQVGLNKQTGRLQIKAQAAALLRNIRLNASKYGTALTNRLAGAVLRSYNASRGMIVAEERSCMINYDQTGFENKVEFYEKGANALETSRNTGAECQKRQWAVAVFNKLKSLGHKGTTAIKTLKKSCGEGLNGAGELLDKLIAANNGQEPTAANACSIAI